MDKKKQRSIDSHVKVRDFYTAQPAIFDGSAAGRQMMADHTDHVAKMSDHVSAAMSGRDLARKATSERRSCRQIVFRALVAIRGISEILRGDTNAVDDLFVLPKGASDEELLKRAGNVLAFAAPRADEFVQHGLPESVLKDLPGQIQALEAALKGQRDAKATHIGANAALDGTLDEGRSLKKGLNAIFRNGSQRDPEVVAQWKNALRVGPSRPAKPAAAPVSKPEQPTTPAKEVA